jgi:predicted outer membrane protein
MKTSNGQQEPWGKVGTKMQNTGFGHVLLGAAMLVGGVWFMQATLSFAGEADPEGDRPQAKEHQSETGDKLRRADRAEDMVVLLHEGNRMGIEGARLALKNGQAERVKRFARVLMTEHQRCNNQIMDYVNQNGLDPRSFADSKPHATDGPMERLRLRQSQNFDRAFILAMTTEHGKMIDWISSTMAESHDAGLRRLLTGQMLVLKKLKKMGETILAQLPANRAG